MLGYNIWVADKLFKSCAYELMWHFLSHLIGLGLFKKKFKNLN